MKINNKNISTEIEKPKEKRTNMHFNQKREKSRKKKEETTIGDKSLDHHQHAPHQEEEHMIALQGHDGKLFLNKW
jgi:hypothetical protein